MPPAKPGSAVNSLLLRAGRAGVLLVNCLIASTAGPDPQATTSSVQPLLEQYSAICTSASHPGSGASDEVLYGRAGTLLGALLLRQRLGAQAVPDTAVTALARAILTSGGWGAAPDNHRAASCWSCSCRPRESCSLSSLQEHTMRTY